MKRPSHLRRSVLVVLSLFLMASVLISCSDDDVAETGSGFEARRIDSSIWASTDSSQPNTLLSVTDSAWHNLVGVNMVTTNGSGQAELKGPNCSALYVYQNSGLTLSGCPKGGGTGTCSTGAMVIKNCDVTISTMPADVTTSGTWAAVTYLEAAQLTLVIVAEGAVDVVPAVGLDFRGLDPAQPFEPDLLERFQVNVTAREFGEAAQVQVSDVDAPVFYYTASDQRLSELQNNAPLPPPRTWLGLEELPPLSNLLGSIDPNWPGWLGRIADQADQDGIPLGAGQPALVRIVDGEPQPDLAVGWEVGEDGMSWIFTLDPERERTDGTPYTAGFVAEVLSQPDNGPKRVAGFLGVEVLDDFALQVFLEGPNPEFLPEISGIEFPE